MKNYNKIFNQKVEEIIKELYYNPIDKVGTKQKQISYNSEKMHVDFLEEIGIIKAIDKRKTTSFGNEICCIQLERKGYEVFEKYNGWLDYKKKVIDKTNKIEKAKTLAQSFWWIPVLISVLILVISIIALLIKK